MSCLPLSPLPDCLTPTTSHNRSSTIPTGASCVDDGAKSRTVLIADGLDSVDTSLFRAGSGDLLFRVVYRCSDEAGNEALPVARVVRVVDPCPDQGSSLCPGSRTCSVAGVCPGCTAAGACFEWPEVELEEAAPAATTDSVAALVASSAVPDTTPPLLRLLGSGTLAFTDSGDMVMIHQLDLGEPWEDPGFVAVDDVDGDVSSRARVETRSGALDTRHPTGPSEPYSLRFTVADSAGNTASAVRRIHVVCPPGTSFCPADEFWPGSEPACAAMGACGLNAALLIGGADAAGGRGLVPEGGLLQLMLDPLDRALRDQPLPPVLRLLGPEVVRVPQGAPYYACEAGAPARVVCDRGAAASDPNTGGDLTAAVAVCPADSDLMGPFHLFSAEGVAPCAIDTSVPGNHTVSFAVRLPRQDGGAAVSSSAVRRVVQVVPSCGQSETLCPGQTTCSESLVCRDRLLGGGGLESLLLEEGAASQGEGGSAEAGNIELSLVGPAFVEVRRGSSYARCKAGAIHRDEAPCDGGADVRYGGGTSTEESYPVPVFSLPGTVPASSCLGESCQGLEFAAKGLDGCGVDTWAPEGSTYVVQFVAVDPAARTAVAVNRTVTIAAPCEERDDFLCGDGTCSPVPCGDRGRLLGAASGTAPPDLTVLGPPLVVLRYGEAILPGGGSYSLLPCGGRSEAHQGAPPPPGALPPCGAIASDVAGADISSDIRVREDPVDGSRWSCSVEDLVARGPPFCLPGLYRYRYSVRDEAGLEAEATREVVVAVAGKVRTALVLDTSGLVALQVELLAEALKDPTSPQYGAVVESMEEAARAARVDGDAGVLIGSLVIVEATPSTNTRGMIVVAEVEVLSYPVTADEGRRARSLLQDDSATPQVEGKLQDLKEALSSSISSGELAASLEALNPNDGLTPLSLMAPLSSVEASLSTPDVDVVSGEVLSVLSALRETYDALNDALLSSSSIAEELASSDAFGAEQENDLREQHEALVLGAITASNALVANFSLAPELVALASVAEQETAAAEALLQLRAQTEEQLASVQLRVKSLEESLAFLGSIDAVGGPAAASDEPPRTCAATAGVRSGFYSVSFVTIGALGNQDDPMAPPEPPQGPSSSSSSSRDQEVLMSPGDGRWGGYRIGSRARSGIARPEDSVVLPRSLGGADGRNVLLGGLDVQQRRSGMHACGGSGNGGSFSGRLSGRCNAQSFYELLMSQARSDQDRDLVSQHLHRLQDPSSPYGFDPVFVPGTRLYDGDLAGCEELFYNTTERSPELNVNGAPYMWYPAQMSPGGRSPGSNSSSTEGALFSVVLDTAVDASRARELWAAVGEGGFLDGQTSTVEAAVVVYNRELGLLAYSDITFSWTPHGSIAVKAGPPAAIPASAALNFSLALTIFVTVAFSVAIAAAHCSAWLGMAARVIQRAFLAMRSLKEQGPVLQNSYEYRKRSGPARHSSVSSFCDESGSRDDPEVHPVEPSSDRAKRFFVRASSIRLSFKKQQLMELPKAITKRTKAAPLTLNAALETSLAAMLALATSIQVAATLLTATLEPAARYDIHDSPQLSQAR